MQVLEQSVFAVIAVLDARAPDLSTKNDALVCRILNCLPVLTCLPNKDEVAAD